MVSRDKKWEREGAYGFCPWIPCPDLSALLARIGVVRVCPQTVIRARHYVMLPIM